MWYACFVVIVEVVVGVSFAVSVLAGAIAVLAWRAADPLELRRLSAAVAETLRGVSDELAHVRDVELPRTVAQAEALLERAEMRFESAESKRKSVDAKAQRMDRADASAAPEAIDHMAPGLSDGERRAALRSMMRGA